MRPAAKPARRPGRPSDSSPDLRARRLDAAAIVVGREGVAGTTLVAIARRARVTPALVHYYFGSKRKLVDALFDERIAPVVLQAGKAITAGPSLSLESVVTGYLRALGAAPWLPPILAREVLCEGGCLRAKFVAKVRPLLGALPQRIAAGQTAGSLRRNLDPRLVVVSLMSAVVWPVIAGPVWRDVLEVRAGEADTEELARHIAAVLSHGLEPPHA